MSLAFQNISHSYGKVRVLQDISLSASEGEILCLLGPSGGGKSTLLRLAAGLERVQSGRIALDGQLLADTDLQPPPEARPIGLVFQDHVLFPHLTVGANIAFGLERSQNGTRSRERVAELLEQMNLQGLGERFPHELSGGQQQRVALARALAPAPQVLLLDEPFASVDSTLRRELRRTTRSALKAAGTTAIVVTHDPEEAMALADSIAVMADGQIAQHAAPAEIWAQPATLAVALLFGDARPVSGKVSTGHAETAFGSLPCALPPGLATLAVRPSGIELNPATAARPATARVVDVRLLGTSWQVELQSLEQPQLTALATIETLDGIAAGTLLATALHSDQCFVFAAAD